MDSKDWFILTLGALLGIPTGIAASIVASVLQGPVLDALSGYRVIRLLSRTRVFKRSVLDGNWEQEWHVESENWPEVNSGNIQIFPFWDFVAAEYQVQSRLGTLAKFRVVAHLFNNHSISGRYFNTRGGYHGTLHFIIHPSLEKADGYWAGYSSAGVVRSGKWVLRKVGQSL